MEFVDFEVRIPKELERYISNQDNVIMSQQYALLLFPLIHNQTISYGKAAEILGISKYDLIEIYEDLGIPYYDMDYSEVEEDIAVFRKLEQIKS